MMWNQNDTKYIIKRLILYIAISCIVFFGAQSCAKAQNVEPVGNMEYWLTNGNVQPKSKSAARFYGELFYHSTDATPADINGVFAGLNNTVSGQYFAFSMLRGQPVPTLTARIQFSDGSWTSCEIMNEIKDYAQGTMYSAVCNLSGSGNKIIYKYGFIWSDSAGYSASYNSIYMSAFNVFENAQQLQNYTTQLSSIQNAINAQAQQAHADSQAQTDAINSVDSSIQAQTDWQQQDFNVDTSQITAITDLISTGDKNQIRDLMMFPARILMLIGAHISSNYCTAYNLGSLYGTNLILPCINWETYVGSALYNTIDTIISIGIYIGLIIYIRKLLDYAFSLGATTFESVNVEVFN